MSAVGGGGKEEVEPAYSSVYYGGGGAEKNESVKLFNTLPRGQPFQPSAPQPSSEMFKKSLQVGSTVLKKFYINLCRNNFESLSN